MENLNKEKLLGTFLAEAVDMLEDARPGFALFQKQRYYRFKSALDNFQKPITESKSQNDGG